MTSICCYRHGLACRSRGWYCCRFVTWAVRNIVNKNLRRIPANLVQTMKCIASQKRSHVRLAMTSTHVDRFWYFFGRHVTRESNNNTTGIDRVQALGDISRSALCCHSNETRAPIANPSNIVHNYRAPLPFPSYIRVRAVVLECGEGQTYRDRQTDTQTHRRPSPIYISPRLRLTRNVMIYFPTSPNCFWTSG